jgi:hypothetical protein
MNIARFIILLAVVVMIAGCALQKPTPDPLAGFHRSDVGNLDDNKAITDDYEAYIQTLPAVEKKYSRVSGYYQDGTGQHAVQIEIPLNGRWYYYILFYDKDDKRIKVVRYVDGGYRS